MTAYFLGIDVSTTATKALLVNASGEVVAVASTSYPFETPHPMWSEQDPALWWDGTQKSIRLHGSFEISGETTEIKDRVFVCPVEVR